MKTKYKKGDLVRVYSLQSFCEGGFINGRVGIVKQDQMSGDSVLVIVRRKHKSEESLDTSYEVYAKQLRVVCRVVLTEKLNEKIDKIKRYSKKLGKFKKLKRKLMNSRGSVRMHGQGIDDD